MQVKKLENSSFNWQILIQVFVIKMFIIFMIDAEFLF